MDYWLIEAEEWARFRRACNLQRGNSIEPDRSTKFES
jgi:hypothetical protein